MNRIFTIIYVLVSCLPFYINAQGLVLVPTETHLTGNPLNELSATATVVNVSNSLVGVKVKRTALVLTLNDTLQYCWAGTCQNPNNNYISVSQDTVFLQPGDTVGPTKHLIANDYPYHNNPATDIVNYLFYDVFNPADSVSITFTYDFVTGINNQANPAGTYLSCSQAANEDATEVQYNITDFRNGKLIIRNLLGSLVKEILLTDKQGHLVVSTSGMPSGIYMYLLCNNGEPVATKKMIIAHR